MNDGTGDTMTGVIHTPAKQRYPGLLVVAGHGFGGDADSAYMKWITKFFFDQDIAVCRLNLRGAGNSRPLCRDNYHGARGEDLIRFWDWLLSLKEPAVPFQVTRTYFAGTSLSGSVLANAFAKIDDNSVGTVSDLSGVIGGLGLCFAFDMQTSARENSFCDELALPSVFVGQGKATVWQYAGVGPSDQDAHRRGDISYRYR